jgi:hypothetical protein
MPILLSIPHRGQGKPLLRFDCMSDTVSTALWKVMSAQQRPPYGEHWRTSACTGPMTGLWATVRLPSREVSSQVSGGQSGPSHLPETASPRLGVDG